jgi:hypothetical protein
MTELLIPFAVLGWLFVSLLIIGLMTNGKQCAIAPDQFVGTCLIADHYADETISAWAHRNHHKRTERFINWLFNDQNHCALSYVSEMRGDQNNPTYRKE